MSGWTTDFVIELLGSTNGGIERIRDAHNARIDQLHAKLVTAQGKLETIRNCWSTHELSNEKLAAILGKP